MGENGAATQGGQSLNSTYKTRARRNIIRTLATVSIAFFLCFVWNQVTVCLSVCLPKCLSVCRDVCLYVTTRQQSCEKVMFSVVCFSHYVHKRVSTVQSPAPTRETCSNLFNFNMFKPFHYEPRTSASGRLAFYLNAFLSLCCNYLCHVNLSLYLSVCLIKHLNISIGLDIYRV